MRSSPPLSAVRAAQTAFVVGILYAAVSIYWGVGGTWLLNTVSSSLEHQGRAGDIALSAVWIAAALKVIAAVLPLLALRGLANPTRTRQVRILAWMAAVILTGYGTVLTVVGLLVQAEVIHASATADHRALAWHAYFWDPWFLIWGLLITVALRRGRHRDAYRPAEA